MNIALISVLLQQTFSQIKLKVLWEHLITCVQFCLQNPWPCVIALGLVTVKYFLQDCPIPFWQFRAQFPSDYILFCKFSFPFQRKGQTKPSQAQINFSVSEMSIMPDEHCLWEFDTWTTTLQAVTDELLFFFKVKIRAAHCRFLSSRKLNKTTFLFCLQLLFINASTWGSSQLQTEVYNNTKHTEVWYNSMLLATILNPWSIFKTPSPFYVPKYLKALVFRTKMEMHVNSYQKYKF